MSSSSPDSLDALLSDARAYLRGEEEATFRAQVEEMVQAKDEAALRAHFRPRIAFGTAGLRARMAPGYHNINCLVVLQTSQAFARYIEAQARAGAGADEQAQKDAVQRVHEQGLVLGYDGRHRSRRFAELCASAFLAAGFRVHLFSEKVATPFVPFGLLHLKAAAGVVVTASHNPKDDNGYKVYWNNGAQIIPPHDAGISDEITRNLEPWHLAGKGDVAAERIALPFDAAHPLLSDPLKEVTDAYFAQAAREYCWRSEANRALTQAQCPVTYTAMHGVGAPFTARALECFGLPAYIPTPAQIAADPEFPTVKFPNPEEGKGALALAMAEADRAGSSLILANDPDADRLAVAEKVNGEWKPLNGNQIALLLADWAFSNYVEREKPSAEQLRRSCMIASTVSSGVLGAMAAKEGFNFYPTLTGFKWMGNRAAQAVSEGERFLLAFEVEIGFLVGPQSYDKDGVRTAAIFNEMYADLRLRRNRSAHEHLEELYQRYGYFHMDTSYFFCDPASGALPRVFERLRNYTGKAQGQPGEPGFKADYPTSVGGVKVLSVRDVTLGTDSGEADGVSRLPRDPSSHMLTFRFEGGATCTLRNSGTEPKLKYYVESSAKTRQEAEQSTKRIKDAVIEEFVQPQKNGLEAPKIAQ